MYFPKIKALREEFEYTQQYVADYLDIKRTTYASWETGHIILPLDIADELAILYNVPISYILGLKKCNINGKKIKMIDYEYMRNKLKELKEINNHSYSKISKYIDTNKSTVNRYFNGKISIPTDKLILLCELYDIEIDELCGTK
ncbi:MAG: transcriptional regulator [Clostridiales bacterium]|nr:transcriptional regulator [Clostridiales bacterium]